MWGAFPWSKTRRAGTKSRVDLSDITWVESPSLFLPIELLWKPSHVSWALNSVPGKFQSYRAGILVGRANMPPLPA